VIPRIVSIEVGGSFTAAIDHEGGLYTFGANTSGELGHGDYSKSEKFKLIKSLRQKTPIVQFSSGGSFIIALGQNMRGESQTLTS
jgi:alpha-tubulin suppressor-like RCC1 family protein